MNSQLLRRHFFTSSASGIGALALSSLLGDDGVLAAQSGSERTGPHFAPRAKRCIFIFLAGAPSQLDLLDPKPELVKRDGQMLPASVSDGVRLAFTDASKSKLKGSPRTFERHGE